MRIRDLRGEDVPALLSIYNYYIANTSHTFEEEPLSLPAFTARVNAIARAYPFFVAEDGGTVAGYAYLDCFNPRSAYRFTADLSLYLAQEYTGRGTGGLLLARIEEAARARGIRNLISLVTSENGPSVRFHEKHGFLPAGELTDVGFKFGAWHSVRYYQKSIPQTDACSAQ